MIIHICEIVIGQYSVADPEREQQARLPSTKEHQKPLELPLMRPLDPGRKGLRASRSRRYPHPPPPPPAMKIRVRLVIPKDLWNNEPHPDFHAGRRFVILNTQISYTWRFVNPKMK